MSRDQRLAVAAGAVGLLAVIAILALTNVELEREMRECIVFEQPTRVLR